MLDSIQTVQTAYYKKTTCCPPLLLFSFSLNPKQTADPAPAPAPASAPSPDTSNTPIQSRAG